MKRREFITLLGGAAAWPVVTHAQQPGKLPRIGYLSPSSAASGFLGRDNAFREGLSELGYVEGKNIIIEYRFADGQFDRLPALAAELVALKVDIIVAVVTQASVVAKEATATIPIVMVAVSDPLGSGLVPSLARQEATLPEPLRKRRRWSGNRCSCSRKSSPTPHAWRSCGTQTMRCSRHRC